MECKEKRKNTNAPVKVGRLSILDSPPERLMKGKVGHHDAMLLLDRGAARSVVPPRMMKKSEYIDKSLTV